MCNLTRTSGSSRLLIDFADAKRWGDDLGKEVEDKKSEKWKAQRPQLDDGIAKGGNDPLTRNFPDTVSASRWGGSFPIKKKAGY